MIETEQKIIQIGSNDGVTLFKKDLAKLGAKRGDIVKIRVDLLSWQFYSGLPNHF